MFRVGVRAVSAAALVMSAVFAPIPLSSAHANDRTARTSDSAAATAPAFEVWTGASVAPNNWSTYIGTTVSPFGPITSGGWRIRVVAGGGGYEYQRSVGSPSAPHYDAYFGFADALIGYHQQIGSLTVKVFTGASWIDHVVRPPDPAFEDDGRLGIKGAIETWWNLSERVFLKLDGTVAQYFAGDTSFTEGAVRSSLGFRIIPNVQIGPEAGFTARPELVTREAGGFVRYEWAEGALALSSGYLDTNAANSNDGTYVRGSYLMRF